MTVIICAQNKNGNGRNSPDKRRLRDWAQWRPGIQWANMVASSHDIKQLALRAMCESRAQHTALAC
jgi:hypothetical protein